MCRFCTKCTKTCHQMQSIWLSLRIESFFRNEMTRPTETQTCTAKRRILSHFFDTTHFNPLRYSNIGTMDPLSTRILTKFIWKKAESFFFKFSKSTSVSPKSLFLMTWIKGRRYLRNGIEKTCFFNSWLKYRRFFNSFSQIMSLLVCTYFSYNLYINQRWCAGLKKNRL